MVRADVMREERTVIYLSMDRRSSALVEIQA